MAEGRILTLSKLSDEEIDKIKRRMAPLIHIPKKGALLHCKCEIMDIVPLEYSDCQTFEHFSPENITLLKVTNIKLFLR